MQIPHRGTELGKPETQSNQEKPPYLKVSRIILGSPKIKTLNYDS